MVMKLLKITSNLRIMGIENSNHYYDVSIKEWRFSEFEKDLANRPDSLWIFLKGFKNKIKRPEVLTKQLLF